MDVPYHSGELEVQERAGVRKMAVHLGGNIGCEIQPFAQEILRDAPMAVVSTVDENGRSWASSLVGEPGFMQATGERTLRVGAKPTPSDPLDDNLRKGARIGLLAVDFATGRRMKIKGEIGLVAGDGFQVRAERVYALCPKHVQARTWEGVEGAERPGNAQRGRRLSCEQWRLVSRADTFFVASFHAETGADASHRGGFPGFVEVVNDRTLAWTDYPGNRMFNTLGNLTVNPKAGLLFVDFERGDTLQMTGEAKVDWDDERAAQFAGAERAVEFRVHEVVEISRASASRWRFWGYSAFNPRQDAKAHPRHGAARNPVALIHKQSEETPA